MVVSSITIRNDVYDAIRTLLVANKPSYTDKDDNIREYTILSEFSRDNPSFPQIVINSANINVSLITLDGGTNEQMVDVQLDFYEKQDFGFGAIESGIDSVQNTILTNQSSLKDDDKLVLMEEPFDESNPANFEENNQQINTKSFIIKLKLT